MNPLRTVREILAQNFGVVTPINEESVLAELGMDSLDTVEFVMWLEEEFDIEIPDEDAEKWQTVGDVVAYVSLRVYKPEPGSVEHSAAQ